MESQYYLYIFNAILTVISIILILFCIIRRKGASHNGLVFFTFLLCLVVTICFGGEAVLARFDMGWRCTPFNTMLILGAILFIIILGFGMKEFSALKDTNPTIVWCGYISISLVIIMTLLSLFFYFQFSSWHDGLTTYNNQIIVYANDQHGGSSSWRYYSHVNSLVHGIEITQDGWWGYPPFKS